MSTGTQEHIIDAEIITDIEVTKHQPNLAVRHEISPERFAAEIENRKALKKILVDYVKEDLQEGHHFYYASKLGKDNPLSLKPKDGEKPSLNKEGALNVCHTMQCYPGQTNYERIEHDGGHFTVYADATIFNAAGVMIATSRGTCSTLEDKYRYRWVYENQVPRDLDKNTLVSRSGQGWKQFRLEHPNPADLGNTIVKMADKRALKGAVDKLPVVSDIFAPSVEPDDVTPIPPSEPAKPTVQKTTKSKASEDVATEPDKSQPEPSETEGIITLKAINELLKTKCGDGEMVDEDRAKAFLKGRDPSVMPPAALRKLLDELRDS